MSLNCTKHSSLKSTLNKSSSKIYMVVHFIFRAIKAAISFMNIGISKRLAGTILYATESGTAETFAYELADVFNYIFNVRVSITEQVVENRYLKL